MSTQILDLVGNPRPESRTHALARTLAAELARVIPDSETSEADLARRDCSRDSWTGSPPAR
jgi:hypothetical protein